MEIDILTFFLGNLQDDIQRDIIVCIAVTIAKAHFPMFSGFFSILKNEIPCLLFKASRRTFDKILLFLRSQL